MKDYNNLVEALRCKGMSKECDSCGYGYRYCPDSECNDACHVERIIADAADAIVALGLDNEDYEHENRRLHGEIEALQAELAVSKGAIRILNYNIEQMREDRMKLIEKEMARLKREVSDENISKFADGEWWKEAQE